MAVYEGVDDCGPIAESGHESKPVLTDRPSHRATFWWYVFLVSFLIIPNLPLLLAARSLNLLTSGYVDLDYIVVALLSLFLPRAATFLLLTLAVLGDFIHAAFATYLFLRRSSSAPSALA
jgi:hypothetical protein